MYCSCIAAPKSLQLQRGRQNGFAVGKRVCYKSLHFQQN